MDFYQAFLLGTGQYGSVHKAVEHLGQYGDDVYAHVGSVDRVYVFVCVQK